MTRTTPFILKSQFHQCSPGTNRMSAKAGVGLVLETHGCGSFVTELVGGGNADQTGKVQVGDQLLLADDYT
jgi:hypothetical protein